MSLERGDLFKLQVHGRRRGPRPKKLKGAFVGSKETKREGPRLAELQLVLLFKASLLTGSHSALLKMRLRIAVSAEVVSPSLEALLAKLESAPTTGALCAELALVRFENYNLEDVSTPACVASASGIHSYELFSEQRCLDLTAFPLGPRTLCHVLQTSLSLHFV